MRAIITDIRAGKAAAPQTVEKAADLGGVRGCPVRHGDHRRVRRV